MKMKKDKEREEFKAMIRCEMKHKKVIDKFNETMTACINMIIEERNSIKDKEELKMFDKICKLN